MSEVIKGLPDGVTPERAGRQKPFCMFISGGMETYAGARGIRRGLEDTYGPDNVKLFNSVFSPDPQSTGRFEEMADVIRDRAPSGLRVVAHSLGSVELRKALSLVTDKDPKFFDRPDNTDNFDIALMSPSGMSGGLDALKFLNRAMQYARNQTNLPFHLSKSNSHLRGIDAVTAFPPAGIKTKELVDGMHDAFPDLSQYKGAVDAGVKIAAFVPEQNYASHLSPEVKENVESYDAALRAAIENRNNSAVRMIIAKRGEVLRNDLGKVYDGDYEGITKPLLTATEATMGGYIQILNTLTESLTRIPIDLFAKLQEKGVGIRFIVSDYDIVTPLSHVLSFFDSPEKAQENVTLSEGTAHAFPVLQRDLFAKTVKGL